MFLIAQRNALYFFLLCSKKWHYNDMAIINQTTNEEKFGYCIKMINFERELRQDSCKFTNVIIGVEKLGEIMAF